MKTIDTHILIRRIIKYLLIIILIMSIFGILLLIGYYGRPIIEKLVSKRETIGISSMNDNEEGLKELVIY